VLLVSNIFTGLTQSLSSLDAAALSLSKIHHAAQTLRARIIVAPACWRLELQLSKVDELVVAGPTII